MKVELNTDLLSKMGWIKYSISRGVGFNFFSNDEDVLFFFNEDDNLWVIKKTKSDHYLFISVRVSEKEPKFKTTKFFSNLDLFSLIKQNMACSKRYKRILNILKLEI